MSRSPSEAIVIGLGGNLGGPEKVMTRFVDVSRRLQALWGPARASQPYLTAPIGPVQDQPVFVNAVLAFWPEPTPNPEDVLALLQALEAEHGRERDVPGGARTLDLDLLLHARETRDEPGLRVPHPRMAQRAFVLVPLKELFGDAFVWDSQIPPVGSLLGTPELAEQTCTPLENGWGER